MARVKAVQSVVIVWRRIRARQHRNFLRATTTLTSLGAMLLSSLAPLQAFADPQGMTVVSGSATNASGTTTYNGTSYSSVTTTTTGNTVVNAQSVNVSSNQLWKIDQQSASNIFLARVIGGDRTVIDGVLLSNGRVVLVNQNGILFGGNSKVDVNGLVASTIDIDLNKSNLATGFLHFSGNQSGNAVINQGSITVANAGLVALLGPGVANDGVITATMGSVQLAAGTKAMIDLSGDKLINFIVDVQDNAKVSGGKEITGGSSAVAAAPQDANGNAMASLVSVSANGKIYADGGQVRLTAHAASNLVANAINMDGLIQAKYASSQQGSILLQAGVPTDAVWDQATDTEKAGVMGLARGKTIVNGKLDASGTTTGERGGSIKVLGENVDIGDYGILDVRGSTSALAGSLRVGGDGYATDPLTVLAAPLATGTFLATGAQVLGLATPGYSGNTYNNDLYKAIYGYIVYYEGDIPLSFGSAHDGKLKPATIVERGTNAGGFTAVEDTSTSHFFYDNILSYTSQGVEQYLNHVEGGRSITDTSANKLAIEIVDQVKQITGHKANFIMANISRDMLDLARDLDDKTSYVYEAVQPVYVDVTKTQVGNNFKATYTVQHDSQPYKIWKQWNNYLTQNKQRVEDKFDKGLFIDVHGYGSDEINSPLLTGFGALSVADLTGTDESINTTRLDESTIRALANNNMHGLTHAQLLKGENSFGEIIAQKTFTVDGTTYNMAAVPDDDSPQTGDQYFQGEINVDKYGTMSQTSGYNKGQDAFQLETPSNFRQTAAIRKQVSANIANAAVEFVNMHYYGTPLKGSSTNAAGYSGHTLSNPQTITPTYAAPTAAATYNVPGNIGGTWDGSLGVGNGNGSGNDSGNDNGSGSGADNGSGSGSGSGNDNGSGSGADNGSGSGSGSGNDNGSGSGADNGSGSGSGSGNDNGSGSGADNGSGSGADNGSGSGSGNGSGSGADNGSGSGSGNGSGSGADNGSGSGSGSGAGNGNGSADNGSGSGSGSGNGNGSGSGSGNGGAGNGNGSADNGSGSGTSNTPPESPKDIAKNDPKYDPPRVELSVDPAPAAGNISEGSANFGSARPTVTPSVVLIAPTSFASAPTAEVVIASESMGNRETLQRMTAQDPLARAIAPVAAYLVTGTNGEDVPAATLPVQ